MFRYSLLFICVLLVGAFYACSKKETATYQVSFNTNGAGDIPPQQVAQGGKAAKPADPIKDDVEIFVDWHSDAALTNAFDFNAEINADITLHAKYDPIKFAVPDANFKAALKTIAPNAFTNDMLMTQHPDVKNLQTMEITEPNITSVSGIEFFKGLLKLNIQNAKLTSLDVSALVQLTELTCWYNQITSLDLSKNMNLTSLNCSFNKLASLDVSKNVNLIKLNCASGKLSKLDVTQNVKLVKLICDSNELTGLNVSKNIELDYLACSSNRITKLDLTKNRKIPKTKQTDKGLYVGQNVQITWWQ